MVSSSLRQSVVSILLILLVTEQFTGVQSFAPALHYAARQSHSSPQQVHNQRQHSKYYHYKTGKQEQLLQHEGRTTRCPSSSLNAVNPDDSHFVLAVLGDLHLTPKDMECYEEAREHITTHLENEAFLLETPNTHVISLGDLGSSGLAGTTACFTLAKEYLDGFSADYSLVTGNHDLEGLDEFENDYENIVAFQKIFKDHVGSVTPGQPQFCIEVAKKILCVGLSTLRFRDAPHSSHEVFIDDAQIAWFKDILARHQEKDGWKVLVFTHAPPMGSGLRVLQGLHIKNGCAWLNHSSGSDSSRRSFAALAREHKCIKLWCSGHFHLSHDYEDSISVKEECAFVQVGVIGVKSTRDGRRQTRLVSGDDSQLNIYTINHHKGGEELRLDMTIKYADPTHPFIAHGHEDYDHNDWFSAFVPQPYDGCYVETSDGIVASGSRDAKAVCWWHMADGKVLGVHDNMVVEYDSETLSPLGVVIDSNELREREVVVQEGGQALMLVSWNEAGTALADDVEVVHPNADGTYFRRYQRNKKQRDLEKKREAKAKEWLKQSGIVV